MFRAVTTSLLLCILIPSSSQDTLSYAEQLRAIELEMDSLSIFNLIDSLFSMDVAPKSELNVRFGFSSSVTSAGRDYDLNQAGLSPGIAYYHKSGLYGDLSGFWNSGLTPKYNPTILSVGYLGLTSKKWSYSFDYEKWYYNPKDSSENPLTNSLGVSTSYDFKVGYASLDYSLLFGQETAHRIIGNVSGKIKLGKWWIFKNINLYPSANIMIGNGSITTQMITREQVQENEKKQIQLLINFSELTDRERIKVSLAIKNSFNNGRITEQKKDQLLGILAASGELTQEQKDDLSSIIVDGYKIEDYIDEEGFGLLNYSFTLPLSLSTGRLNILLSYTYSIPVKLPGDSFSVKPIGYFGASLSYRIPFK
jgi:hypothetical protein